MLCVFSVYLFAKLFEHPSYVGQWLSDLLYWSRLEPGFKVIAHRSTMTRKLKWYQTQSHHDHTDTESISSRP